MARFKSLCTSKEDCEELVREISIAINRDDFLPLVDFYTPYTPTRLRIALDQYKTDGDVSRLEEEIQARYLYDSNVSGNIIVKDYPPLVHIELSPMCNYRCKFCFQQDEDHFKNMEFMSLDLFKIIIDQLHGNVSYITFSNRGEPTMNPHFIEMLRYCKDKFLDIKLNTNGSLLTKDKIEVILETVNTLVFSVDSVKEYSEFRVNGVFEKVMSNIKMVHKMRKPYHKIKTRVSGVYCGQEDDSNYFDNYVDQTSFIQYHPWKEIYNLPIHKSKQTCNEPFYRMYILYDGTVNSCDIDYKAEIGKNFPKINKDMSVKEVWNSYELSRVRRLHLNGKRSCIYPCNRCPFPEAAG